MRLEEGGGTPTEKAARGVNITARTAYYPAFGSSHLLPATPASSHRTDIGGEVLDKEARAVGECVAEEPKEEGSHGGPKVPGNDRGSNGQETPTISWRMAKWQTTAMKTCGVAPKESPIHFSQQLGRILLWW